LDFSGTDRIDDHAETSQAIEDRDIRTGFLCVTDDIEGLQIGDLFGDRGHVIDVARGTVLLDDRIDRLPSDIAT
jgi:hypothetical protein